MKSVLGVLVTLLSVGGWALGARYEEIIDWSRVRPLGEFPHIVQRVEQLRQDEGGLRRSLPQTRITGGAVASAGQIPYQAAILSNLEAGQALCGGILVSSNYVLTAGVCVDGTSGGIVILGALNLQNENEAGQVRLTFATNDVRLHEDFFAVIFRNNIAAIRLSQSVTLTANIQPARLPALSETRQFAGALGTISGYGRTSDASTSFADVLHYVNNPIMTNIDCFNTAWGGLIDDQKLCLHYLQARSPCDGDVGGPLTVSDAGSSLLVGMYSFGSVIGCETEWPAAFVRITFYLPWIHANTDISS